MLRFQNDALFLRLGAFWARQSKLLGVLYAVAHALLWPLRLYIQQLASIVTYLAGAHPKSLPYSPPTGSQPAGPQQKQPLQISWPGLGIFFWWQLGALKYLQQHYHLAHVPMIGSSAGSFIAVFAATGVDPDTILSTAYTLCLKHNVFSRPLGLLGVWGSIIRQWLEALLPTNTAELCSRHTAIVVTLLPNLARHVLSSFSSTGEVVEACLASAHIPFFLDWKLHAMCQGKRCIDGGFRYVVMRMKSDMLLDTNPSAPTLVFDARFDSELMSSFTLVKCIQMVSLEGCSRLMKQGYLYAQRLDASGALAAFDMEALRYSAEGDNGAKGSQLPAAAEGQLVAAV